MTQEKEAVLTSEQSSAMVEQRSSPAPGSSANPPAHAASAAHGHRFLRTVWYAADALLLLSFLLVGYGAAWEYSTQRYLQGFSDAIISPMASSEEKVEAILNWMGHGPARLDAGAASSLDSRDPIDSLNYRSLLEVCGSATNAFINLANSAGMESRRLLLLDSRRMAKHVVAEVLVDGPWIVVDPGFHVIWRGADGKPLTRAELADPVVFSAATRSVPRYLPEYTFDRTAHIRMSRVYGTGTALRSFLNRRLPGWEDSKTLSLLLERRSLSTLWGAIFLVVWFALLRAALRWYGERRPGLRAIRLRAQFLRAAYAFMHFAS
jgi:hypothetical protein